MDAVAADLSHIDTPAKVVGYVGEQELGAALTGCKVVVIPAGVPRKPGLFSILILSISSSKYTRSLVVCDKRTPCVGGRGVKDGRSKEG